MSCRLRIGYAISTLVDSNCSVLEVIICGAPRELRLVTGIATYPTKVMR